MFRLFIANDRVAAGASSSDTQTAVTEFGSQPADRMRLHTVSGVADMVLTSRLLKRV
jgi:hypothetical protein